MAGSSLGIGLIGAGVVAGFHARAIGATQGAHLAGVCSRTPEGAGKFALQHGIPSVMGTIEELVTHPDVGAVCITTPSGLHLEPALAAIRAGKHVMIEKPIEITLERTDEILRAAQHAGVLVGAIFQARFGTGAQALRAAVEAGRFGRLTLCSAYVKWHRAAGYYTGWKGTLALDGGGAVINQGIHAIDLLQWLAGMPTEVFAWTTRRVHTGIEAEDTACAAIRFASGALGTIEATTGIWPGWSRRIEICGETGSAVLEDDTLARWEFREELPHDAAIRASREGPTMGSGAGAPNAIGFEGHLRQIQDFVDAIRGGRPPAVDGREARKAVAVVRAMYDSASRGAPVRL